ncbi:hypothetical protein TREMEDRAFT_60613 [Tremella mesenterica DSM 1558]|uniref:uncharacterized protein n=1 Tax=Tremella mesenterica (strain ATCC 24925 / CBS 8224 / DSM 1558 / NBRC 9311 / NRRL Y-6157 / RJB 2259-6 / UBC 559-6) TaxID=578456 RepID=UPI0003F49B77|nr:uncharacterized protein TREMEDRAFT_60613 [Tremella mesenterica DSM 1558]EIW71693.1 hypothetical protein TREMEDRAFT_60613 [Tremella mesenterica DSM 1558]
MGVIAFDIHDICHVAPPLTPEVFRLPTLVARSSLSAQSAVTTTSSIIPGIIPATATRAPISQATSTAARSSRIISASSLRSSSSTPTSSFSASLVSPTSASIQSVSTSSVARVAQAATSLNRCAGDWDWQAWGAISALIFGAVIGGLLWLLWGLLRLRLPALYSPRTWFVDPSARPSRTWSFTGFVLPFLHMPSLSSDGPLSAASASLPSIFTALKLTALASLLALAAGLPLISAGVPCLSQTSPQNPLGGRLGTLTDLSLLSLLNALDPSPDSPSISSLLHLPPVRRALPSTIRPVVDSARARLIVLLVIIVVLAVGGGLFVIFRTYRSLARYRRHFENDICNGLDMVFISSRDAPGWLGKSEERLKRWFRDNATVGEGDNSKDLDVIGVFAVPDTTDLRLKVAEREKALLELETSESVYIKTHKLDIDPAQPVTEPREAVWWASGSSPARPIPPTISEPSPEENLTASPRGYHRLSTGRRSSQLDPASPTSPRPQNLGIETRFHEINRDSAVYGGRFEIGQRIKRNEQGEWVSDPSPDSESTNPLGSGRSAESHASPEYESPPVSDENIGPSRKSGENVRWAVGTAEGGASQNRRSEERSVQRSASARSIPQSSSESPLGGSVPESVLLDPGSDLLQSRKRFKDLDTEVVGLQQRTFSATASGAHVEGWILVGHGVRSFPHAWVIEGRTTEDILWEKLSKQSRGSLLWYWIKIGLIGAVLSIIMVPFIALSVGTAPGFSHYLGLLRPLERIDGLGSGLAEGLAPAMALFLAVSLAIFTTNPFKGTFYLLLWSVIWLVTVASLEYSVQGFVSHVQEGRTVGDGAIFSTWFIFVLLLDVAIIVPAIYLLRPYQLIRYLSKRRSARTPREKFRLNLPSSFNPSYAFAPIFLAVFYANSLLFLFPLLSIPIILLLFLSFIAIRHSSEYVNVDRTGTYAFARLLLWTLRRFGWTLAIQPLIYGLILVSRREWAIGGVSLGCALLTIIISEIVTVGLHSHKRRTSPGVSAAIEDVSRSMVSMTASPEKTIQHRISDSSMLQRVAALLPGYSRLPEDCPVPLKTEWIDDIFRTEKASYASPDFSSHHSKSSSNVHSHPHTSSPPPHASSSSPTSHTPPQSRSPTVAQDRFLYDPSESLRGLVYPPELVAPTPVIWLPNGRGGETQANELMRQGLVAIVDPSHQHPSRHYSESEKRISDPTGPTSLDIHQSHLTVSRNEPRTPRRSDTRGSRSSRRRIIHEDVGEEERREREPASPAEEAVSPLLVRT